MKSFIKNLILFAIVLILSYYTAEYFGSWYDKFVPQYNNSFLGRGRESAIFIAGFPFAYVFFLTFIFQLFFSGNKIKWILILLIPPTLLWILADIQHIYLPVILGLIAFGLAKIINALVAKMRKSEKMV